MKNGKSMLVTLVSRAIGVSLIICACLLGGGAQASGQETKPAAPQHETIVFTAQLRGGANEVPPVTNVELNAIGFATVAVDDVANTLRFDVSLIGLPANSAVIQAHVHEGAAGVTGPVVIDSGLSPANPLPVGSSGGVTFTRSGVPVDPAVATSIIANPRAYYFDVHTALNPDGVARGRLAPGKEQEPKVEPDSTYGFGGTKTMIRKDFPDKTSVEVRLKDPKGALREVIFTYTNKTNGEKREIVFRYNGCEREPESTVSEYYREVITDVGGNQIYFHEQRNKDKKPISGTKRYVDKEGKKHNERYNPKTKEYEETALDTSSASEEIHNPLPYLTVCPNPFKRNEFFGGFSLIREDSDPAFNTYGFNAGYTRYLNPSIGITGDFSANFRKRGDVDLSKYSLLGGITFRPFKEATRKSRVDPFAHALVGGSHFKADSGTASFTENSFTLKIGGGLDINVNKNFFIRPFEINYNPTFFGDETQHNFRIGVGVGFRFGGGSGRPGTEEPEEPQFPTGRREKPPRGAPVAPIGEDVFKDKRTETCSKEGSCEISTARPRGKNNPDMFVECKAKERCKGTKEQKCGCVVFQRPKETAKIKDKAERAEAEKWFQSQTAADGTVTVNKEKPMEYKCFCVKVP